MITTGFNPYQARVSNNTRPRQNNVAFCMDFKPKDLKGIKEEEEDVVNNLIAYIATGIIKKSDMGQASKAFFEQNKDHYLVEHLQGLLDKYNK